MPALAGENSPSSQMLSGSQDDVLQDVAANLDSNPAIEAEGIAAEQVAKIKAIIEDEKKFVGGLLEQSSRWQVDGAELRIFFPADKRAFAELLEARESLDKIRTVASQVLGKPVRVCAKIESMAAAAAAGGNGGSRSAMPGSARSSARSADDSGTPELRARFESDPMVRSMLERFGGKISEVKPRQADS
jgi:hypothetical protein